MALRERITSTGLRVRQTFDPAEVLAVLLRDAIYAGYALCDLEEHIFSSCEWFVSETWQGRIITLGMRFRNLEPSVLFLMGDPEGVEPLLQQGLTPRRAYFTSLEMHLRPLENLYTLRSRQSMLRMYVTPESFLRSRLQVRAEQITQADLGDLNQLYQMATGHPFNEFLLEDGVFYGIKQDGMVVATAGTHVISPSQRMAAIGNVFTHPDYRGRGYAQACTSAVTATMLYRLAQGALEDELDRQEPNWRPPLVILNVRDDNDPAIRAYRNLGYQTHGRFIESLGAQRGKLSLLARRFWRD